MKKIFSSVALALLVFVSVPNLTYAANCGIKDNIAVKQNIAGLFPQQSICTVADGIFWVLRILLGLISLVAVVMIVLGGYKYVTSQGNSEAAGAGRKQVTNAVIGLIIAVLAYTIVTVVSNTIGQSAGVNNGGTTTNSGNTNTVTRDQQAAYDRIKESISPMVSYKNEINASGVQNYATFDVVVRTEPNDLAVVCQNMEQDGKIRAVVEVPLKDGGVKKFYSQDQRVNALEGINTTLSFTSQSNNFDLLNPPKEDGKVTTLVIYDIGCGLNISVEREWSSMNGGI